MVYRRSVRASGASAAYQVGKVDCLTVLSSFTLLVGGLVTSFIMELLVYASIYEFWKWNFEMKRGTVDVRELPIPELRGH